MRRIGRRANAGAAALEFGLVGFAFVILLVGVAQLAFFLYAQTALDYAAKLASRQLQTGTVSISIGENEATFAANHFCPTLAPFLSCANIAIYLQPVTNFQTGVSGVTKPTSTTTLNPGSSGSLVLMEVYYTPPHTLWPLNVTNVVGVAAYRNEY
jgi:Flp pilus assembly protein TadG